VAVSGGYDATVRVWDLAHGTPIGEPLTGHDVEPRLHPFQRGVTAVAIGELEGRPVVVSGGGDGTLRVWDLERGTIGEPLTGHEGQVTAVAVGEL
jgi:WD40 repeat protein